MKKKNARIPMKSGQTMHECFERFLRFKSAQGLKEITIKSYAANFHAISKYMNMDINIESIDKHFMDEAIVAMRKKGLSCHTIRSYTAAMKTFLSWCNEEELTQVNIKLYRTEDTIKETYSDEELIRLLKKPNMRTCQFPEYRNWVIVNFLVDSGCRAATIRNIQNRDVDFQNSNVRFRHNKNKRMQIAPLSEAMKFILSEYMNIREGNPDDYLFPNQTGEQLTEVALASAIKRYNKKRGVNNLSIHCFRHTFARKYLLDCGGNAFTLQRLLGHSTLDMTKHYCAIFNADIVKDFDSYSPLTQMSKQPQRIIMR
ncbi:tyrosine-type recombinase/integrase [Eubacteriales bacterium OttesenSCG-928-M02]|nr:tyrosine-type recombinase/integrase [Eubacteriales bacterium OttesenSCG-928-M02]